MIALIAAYTRNRVIGNKGEIPWRIKGEQRRFRELTTGNVVVMGRRSYEEIGHPLPDRYTIVISHTQKYESENCTTAGSLQEAIDLVDKMYVTEIDVEMQGDTYFPEFNMALFDRKAEGHVDGELPYDYVTYTRK